MTRRAWWLAGALLFACSDDSAADPGDAGRRDASTRADAGGAGADGGPDAGSGGGIPRPSGDVADPNLRLIAWNGRPGAVSFTVDDAYGSALDAVRPALDERDVGGTFFVICSAVEAREAEWRAVAEGGLHEVANHSQTHAGASAATVAEASDCHDYIAETLGVAPITFAYPYAEVGDPYRSYSRENYVAARGGGERVVRVGDEIDWTDSPRG
jgi:peptidoglycan/xylan/chitin deacetylase (PgdA/CDA1 family)